MTRGKGNGMYLRAGGRILNTEAISYAEVSGEEAGHPAVEIFFAGTERSVRLEGSEAEAFLRALPVYRPTRED